MTDFPTLTLLEAPRASMAPGDLIPTADFEVGDRIQALEPPSIFWYDANGPAHQ